MGLTAHSRADAAEIDPGTTEELTATYHECGSAGVRGSDCGYDKWARLRPDKRPWVVMWDVLVRVVVVRDVVARRG